MSAPSLVVSLFHMTPENLWSAMRGAATVPGLYTSAEAALMACWLATEEHFELGAISSYADVMELIDRREFAGDVRVHSAEVIVPEEVSV